MFVDDNFAFVFFGNTFYFGENIVCIFNDLCSIEHFKGKRFSFVMKRNHKLSNFINDEYFHDIAFKLVFLINWPYQIRNFSSL